MKQQLQALGASLIFFAIGTVFLLFTRGLPYVYEFFTQLDGDVFERLAMVALISALVIGFQQAVYWLVIRRMAVDRG